jgi:uncharacterized YigZ family protein
MQTIKEHFHATLEVKQSKFIAHLTPYNDYDDLLQQLKKQHPKARHFVTAYRYLNEYEQIVEHSSDDGEPKGTSGKPSLIVLQGHELIDSAVIVVRYFGGTKLGTGGLVRAYSDAVNLVVSEADLIKYQKEVYETIEVDYSSTRLIDYELDKYNIDVIDRVFDAKVIYKVKAPKESMQQFLNSIKRQD